MKTTVIKAGEKIQAKLEEVVKLRDELQSQLEKLTEQEIDEIETDPKVEAIELEIRKLLNELW